jgi:DNA-binding transcriptional LysR family regulator
MAQPPLSISIRKLEEELGSALFDRTSTGVVLTPAGKAMLESARATLFMPSNAARRCAIPGKAWAA